MSCPVVGGAENRPSTLLGSVASVVGLVVTAVVVVVVSSVDVS